MKKDILFLLVSNILNNNKNDKIESNYKLKFKRTISIKSKIKSTKNSKKISKKADKIFNKSKFYKSIEKKNYKNKAFSNNNYFTKKLTKDRQKELTKIIKKDGLNNILRKLSSKKGLTKSNILKKKISQDINWIKLKLLKK